MFPKVVTGSPEHSGGAAPRAVIEARDLEKVYGRGEGGVEALAGESLGVGAGEWVSLVVGPSGSGKSPLVNLLDLLDRPTGCSYRLGGREVSGLERRQPGGRGAQTGTGPAVRRENQKECDAA